MRRWTRPPLLTYLLTHLIWQLDIGIILGQGCGFPPQVHECSPGSWLGETFSPHACSPDWVLVRFSLVGHGLVRTSLLGHGLVSLSLRAWIGTGPSYSRPGLQRDHLSLRLDYLSLG